MDALGKLVVILWAIFLTLGIVIELKYLGVF